MAARRGSEDVWSAGWRAGEDVEDPPGHDVEVTLGPPPTPPPGWARARRGDRVLVVVAAVAAVIAAGTGVHTVVQDRQEDARSELRRTYADYLTRADALLDGLTVIDYCAADLAGDPRVREALVRYDAYHLGDARLTLVAAPAVIDRAEEVRASLDDQLRHLQDRLWEATTAETPPTGRPADVPPEPGDGTAASAGGATCEAETAGHYLGAWNTRRQVDRVLQAMRDDLG